MYFSALFALTSPLNNSLKNHNKMSINIADIFDEIAYIPFYKDLNKFNDRVSKMKDDLNLF